MKRATERLCQALLAIGFLALATVYAVFTVLALAVAVAYGFVRWAWEQAGKTLEAMKS